MLLPLRATTGVVVPDVLLTVIQSPTVGEAGNVNVKVAVITYLVEVTADVFELITETLERITGVIIVGLVLNTTLVEPVEVVTPVPPLATGSVPPVPPLATGSMPVTPVVNGNPVALVNVTDVGVPKIGVASVGLIDSTLLPEPVEVVTPVPPLATGSVPVMPVVRGKPVALVNVTDVGVPKTGVTSVGLVFKTTLPVPVEVVTPVPPLLARSVPVTPVVNGNPVALVNVTRLGMPRFGVTNTAELKIIPEAIRLPDTLVSAIKFVRYYWLIILFRYLCY